MFSSFIVRNTNVHRGSKIVTGLKNNRSAANGSTDHKSNQNEPIKQNVSPTPRIDYQRLFQCRVKGLNQEEIARESDVEQSTVNRNLQYIKHETKIKLEM